MTIAQKFRAYYLPALIGMLLLFGTKFLVGLSNEKHKTWTGSLEGIITTILFIVVLTIVIGFIYQWYDQVYKPRSDIKLFEKLKSLGLEELGLKANEEERKFYGYVSGYYTEVMTRTIVNSGYWLILGSMVSKTEGKADPTSNLNKKYELVADKNDHWVISKSKIKLAQKNLKETVEQQIKDLILALKSAEIQPSGLKEI